MVLQCDKPAAVWGTVDAGATVTVTFKGKYVKTKADAKGESKCGSIRKCISCHVEGVIHVV